MKILPVVILASAAIVQGWNGQSMLIELDIFSGRPNPQWTLTETEIAELEVITTALSITAESPPSIDGLGYRGIVARIPNDPGWSLVALHNTVWIQTGEEVEVRSDPQASVERWLLGTAGSAVDPAVLSRLGGHPTKLLNLLIKNIQ